MTRRHERINDLLREELSLLVQHELKDPRLGTGLISVTEVKVSPDLRHAAVFVSHFGDEAERGLMLKALGHSSSFLHSELVRRLALRHVPELHFQLDPSIERAARITALIHNVVPSVEAAAASATAPAGSQRAP